MDMNTTISIAVIFSIVAVLSQVYAMWNGHRKNNEDEERKKVELEKNLLKLNLKLDQVNNSITMLVESDKAKTLELKEISENIVMFKRDLKAMWKKIDDHEVRLKSVEKEVKA